MKEVIFVFLVFILIAGCRREFSISNTSASYESLDQFFEQNKQPSQIFTANSSVAISLHTRAGAIISFNAKPFLTLDDQPVSGNVSIEVKEIMTPSEMILNRSLTVSNGQPIESGGEYFVRVTQGNRELKLVPGFLMKIKLTGFASAMGNMSVFNGKINTAEISNTINWSLNTNLGNRVVNDTFTFARTLFADSIKWVNCDRFINEPKINYTVFPGNIAGFDSLTVVVQFSGRNSVMPMSRSNTGFKFYSQSLIASPATIIGIGIKDHRLQASIIPVNLQNDQATTLNFQPITETALKEKLSQLN